VAETPAGASIVGGMFPGSEHLISYHVVTHGSCSASVASEPPIELTTGDVVVFPHGDAHAMSSAPGMHNPPDLALYRRSNDRQLPFPSPSVTAAPSPTGACAVKKA
jgi:Cupin